jgi:hypothetical protein
MATIMAATARGVPCRLDGRSRMGVRRERGPAWAYNFIGSREAALNWLALGLLLAAWNVSNDDPASAARPRPDSLRGYGFVSVRAASLHATPLVPCR